MIELTNNFCSSKSAMPTFNLANKHDLKNDLYHLHIYIRCDRAVFVLPVAINNNDIVM